MPLDSRTLQNDHFPLWAEEPPVPSEGSLVPGSQFHEEQWIMAAGMLARGTSFLYVARTMGCSRTTLWRAYYGSKDFRHRVWWERQALNREAELRLSSLRILVAEQIERLVSSGDPATVRWLAERLGLFAGLETTRETARNAPRDIPAPEPQPAHPQPPHPEDPPAVTVPELDDDIPGALRERTPPNPRAVAAILARPEAAGPKGVYPYTVNPDDPYPNLGSALERQGGKAAFSRRL
ncbi:hypothetical protein J2848_001985 [Azospirillum lipoferum]|uniref:Uncharacterized protein n=1 Tax=Azospirillum lipoferum TaxID=193 RepID=A0A5A9GT08_AZOLI|nr:MULTISPECIES: hypothetical protein [Azospirillum]KAA0597560.1 hypothetical protein FZ942_00185 [Azospirillum lipoferum]MCP1610326.1 hypothetical protein [Azospirillum lipoferum]MDW5534181.1 hypothetical protein [Azospirillum sp. NL1]